MPKVGDIIRAEDIKSGGFIGQIIEFPSNLIPSNTLLCDGSELSRETYSELFNVIGTIYGEGDGSTTFNIPDYRGAFLRCTGGNADVLGTLQEDAIRNITGSYDTRPFNSPSNANPRNIYGTSNGVFSILDKTTGYGGYIAHTTATYGTHNAPLTYFNASLVVPTADENRPLNYSVNICIIYE